MSRLLVFQRSRLLLLLSLPFFFATSCAEKPTVDSIANDYIMRWADFYPSRAYGEGVKSAAFHFEDFSKDRVINWVQLNKSLTDILPKILPELPLNQKIDARILLRQAIMEIETWEQDQTLRQQPQRYAEVISQSLTYILVRGLLTDQEKFDATLARMKGIQMLSQLGMQTLKEGRPERTRSAVRILKQAATFYEGNLLKISRNWVPDAEHASLEAAALKTAAIVREFAGHIENTILPNVSMSDSSGSEDYARKLAILTEGRLTPEQLAHMALTEIDLVRELMSAQVLKWWDASQGYSEKAVSDRELLDMALRTMEADRVDNSQDFLTLFTDLTAKAEQFVIKHNIAEVPKPTTLYTALSPAHFSGAAVGGVYSAGPFSPNSDTLFYLPFVSDASPRTQKEGFYRSFNNHFNMMITAHEMFPGHYLQAKVALGHASKIRTIFTDGSYVEGWGSFSEILMLDAGWAEDNTLTRLAHLRKRLENATRAYTSVMVHAEGWDKDKLLAFATTRGLLAPQFATNLWSRVIHTPHQLPTYFLGFHDFEELIRAEQVRLGDAFTIRGFVDGVLQAGAIPIDALGAVLQQDNKLN